jgi:hypothetical protein
LKIKEIKNTQPSKNKAADASLFLETDFFSQFFFQMKAG